MICAQRSCIHLDAVKLVSTARPVRHVIDATGVIDAMLSCDTTLAAKQLGNNACRHPPTCLLAQQVLVAALGQVAV